MNKPVFIGGAAVVGGVALGYVGWRFLLRQLPEAIDQGDLERADALASDLFEAGNLGREVKVLIGLLVLCLFAMVVLGQRDGGSPAAPEGFGFGSYL